MVEEGEMCDDGNLVGGDGCSATCTHEPTCSEMFTVFGIAQSADNCNETVITNCVYNAGSGECDGLFGEGDGCGSILDETLCGLFGAVGCTWSGGECIEPE